MFGSKPRGEAPPNGPLDALERWAAEQPGKTAYTFLGDKGEPLASLTYAQLKQRADAVAAYLLGAAKLEPGARALLVFPPGLDFIVAYLGCLRAGVIAVPVFPPDPTRLTKDLGAFASTAASCGARAALTNTLYDHAKKLGALQSLFKTHGHKWPDLAWHITDTVAATPPAASAPALPPFPSPSALAFLQYTSGSTAEPKGVRITHANLAHNLRVIVGALAVDRATVEVSWLPQYHDMGLIGAYLGLLTCGGEGFYMSPFSFIKRPSLWVSTLAQHKGTHTQAPSFAYALTARKWEALAPKERPALSLKSVRHMINGAEPIDPEAMLAFHRVFGPLGLRKDAIVPTYGLAEHTVFVSTGGKASLTVDRVALQTRSLVVPVAPSHAAAYVATGCGAPPDGSGIEVKIVDPETMAEVTPGRGAASAVGEIWLRSDSVADGYWAGGELGDGVGKGASAAAKALSDEAFGARLGGGAPWLRSGDLGFMHGAELFVVGRQKDLIIVRGANHYPQDLERTAEKACPELRPGCSAAFAADVADALAPAASAHARAAGGSAGGSAELVVLVAELRNEHAPRAAEVAQRVAEAITGAHALSVASVVLIKQGTIFKTKSGKISRSKTKRDFLGLAEGAQPLQPVAAYNPRAGGGGADGAGGAAGAAPAPPPSAAPADIAAARAKPLAELVEDIRQKIAWEANLEPSQLDPSKPLVALGVGSMELVQVRGMLESLYGLDFEESVLATDQATVSNIAAAVKAGAIPESMARATPLLGPEGGAGGGGAEAGQGGAANPPPRPMKRAGPPCCCIC